MTYTEHGWIQSKKNPLLWCIVIDRCKSCRQVDFSYEMTIVRLKNSDKNKNDRPNLADYDLQIGFKASFYYDEYESAGSMYISEEGKGTVFSIDDTSIDIDKLYNSFLQDPNDLLEVVYRYRATKEAELNAFAEYGLG